MREIYLRNFAIGAAFEEQRNKFSLTITQSENSVLLASRNNTHDKARLLEWAISE